MKSVVFETTIYILLSITGQRGEKEQEAEC